MADSNQNRRADFGGFAENDPFAELTRIMGHDPRPSQPQPQLDDDGDFGIDLEKELMGELDFSEFDQSEQTSPEAQAADDRFTAAASDEWVSEGEQEPVFEDLETSLESELAGYDLAPVADDRDVAVAAEADFAPVEDAAIEPERAVLDDVFADLDPVAIEEADEQPRFDATAAVPEPDLSFDEDAFGASLEEELVSYEDDVAGDAGHADAGLAPSAPLSAAAPEWSVETEEAAFGEPAEEVATADAFEPDWTEVQDEEPESRGQEEFAIDPLEEEPVAVAQVSQSWEDDDLTSELNRALGESEPVAAEPLQEDVFEAYEAEADEAASYEAPEAEFEFLPEPEEQDAPAVQAYEPAPQPELSLEDELSALLNDTPSSDALEPVIPLSPAVPSAASVIGAAAAKAASETSWQPAVNTFGRANFSPLQAGGAKEAAYSVPETGWQEPAVDEADYDDSLAVSADEPSHPAYDEPEPVIAPEPVAARKPEAPVAMRGMGYGSLAPAPSARADAPLAAAAPAVSQSYASPAETGEADFDDIFGEDIDLHLDLDEPAPAPQAHAAPASFTPAPAAAPRSGLDALASWQPRSTPVAAAPQARAEAPDVETVEVSEAAYAMADDLDIPEIDYAQPETASNPYDDLEGEIAQAFGDMSFDEPEPVSTPATGRASAEWEQPVSAAATTAQAAIGAMPAATAFDPASNAYGAGSAQWDANAFDDNFDYETDLEKAVSMAAYEEDEPQQPAKRKRGMLFGALAAGVAVIAIGAFAATSFFGGGSDAPAIVRADADPMKVRPENPGGATVPNQNNQVYQRVSGGTQDGAPEQERLISTAEQPVDVTAQAEPPALAPSMFESGDDVPALEGDEETAMLGEEGQGASASPETGLPGVAANSGQPKIEDRIEPTPDTAGVGASDDLAAVAPRRVRTMVVRPDGTMVPREEPVAAAPAAAPSTPDVQTATSLTPPASAADEGGPVVNTPNTVNVVPSQRTETQVAAAPTQQPAAPVQQPAAAQTPPATPVSAPAAPAPVTAGSSEWSMQIASQPTAEGAQASYQDLARRYGNVLEGRGVNIVRADIEGRGTYYRVRIPASSREEAIQLCTRYQGAGGSCFVSR